MRRVCVLAVVLLATLVAAANAQDFRGGITGRITDGSGGRLPGVTVTATNVATKVASTTTSVVRCCNQCFAAVVFSGANA